VIETKVCECIEENNLQIEKDWPASTGSFDAATNCKTYEYQISLSLTQPINYLLVTKVADQFA